LGIEKPSTGIVAPQCDHTHHFSKWQLEPTNAALPLSPY
jgi:hypothetical protein